MTSAGPSGVAAAGVAATEVAEAPATHAVAGAAGELADMHPAYFGLVMATGIVSIASYLLGLRWTAIPLFWANIVFYVIVWSLMTARVVRYRARVVADIMHHGRSVGFFTAVAATCVLGSQFWIIAGAWSIAATLWFFGIFLWAGLTYSIFTILTVIVNAVERPLVEPRKIV